MILDYQSFLTHAGYLIAYIVIFSIVFAESGILIGFFLPGDSLLITLGVLAADGHFNIGILFVLCALGAISGDSLGYAFGRKIGPALFDKPDSRFFKQENLRKAHQFYETYGNRTIVIARFVPFARTFAPILAGIGRMNYRHFLQYNVLGGIGWVGGILILGYTLGKTIPNVDQYVLLIVGAVLVLSVIPAVLEYRKRHKRA